MKTDDYKVIVALYLRGEDLAPDSVTTALGINPSRSQRKGEKRVTSTNREYVTKIGMWGLISDADSNLIADHITRLASLVKLDANALCGVAGVQEAYIDIFVAAIANEDGEGSCEFELSPDNLTDLERMGLPVRLTVTLGKE